MKFGINSIAFAKPFPQDPYSLFEKIRDIGFDLIEIMESNPDNINVNATLSASQRTGLGISLYCYFEKSGDNFWDICSMDAEVRRSGVEHVKHIIDIASKLGISKVSGPFYSMIGKTASAMGEDIKQQWNWVVENTQVLSDYASDRNISIAIEPCSRFYTNMIKTVKDCAEFINLVGNQRNLGYHLNTYHMLLEEKDYKQAIILCGNRLKSFHLSGTNRETPGLGNFDWIAVKEGLEAVNFTGEMIIETVSVNLPLEIQGDWHLFRRTVKSDEELARKGLLFLRGLFENDCL